MKSSGHSYDGQAVISGRVIISTSNLNNLTLGSMCVPRATIPHAPPRHSTCHHDYRLRSSPIYRPPLVSSSHLLPFQPLCVPAWLFAVSSMFVQILSGSQHPDNVALAIAIFRPAPLAPCPVPHVDPPHQFMSIFISSSPPWLFFHPPTPTPSPPSPTAGPYLVHNLDTPVNAPPTRYAGKIPSRPVREYSCTSSWTLPSGSGSIRHGAGVRMSAWAATFRAGGRVMPIVCGVSG